MAKYDKDKVRNYGDITYIELAMIGIGVIYGFLKPGKEDRKTLLKRGFLIGIVLAIILVGLGMIMGIYDAG